MYIRDSVDINNINSPCFKTFPNLSAIEQMNSYSRKCDREKEITSDNKGGIDIYLLLLIITLLNKDISEEIDILPILLTMIN